MSIFDVAVFEVRGELRFITERLGRLTLARALTAFSQQTTRDFANVFIHSTFKSIK